MFLAQWVSTQIRNLKFKIQKIDPFWVIIGQLNINSVIKKFEAFCNGFKQNIYTSVSLLVKSCTFFIVSKLLCFFGSTPYEKLKKIYSNYLTDICVFHICVFYRPDFFTEQNLKDTQKKCSELSHCILTDSKINAD